MRRFLTAVLILSLIFVPLCSYAENFSGEDRIILVLDPGHGGSSTTGEFSRGEAVYNLKVAQYIKEALDGSGSFEVYLTHEDNTTDPSFYDRAVFADSVNADLMISVHFNSTTNPESRGMEAWCSVIERYDLQTLATMTVEYAVRDLPQLPAGGVFHRKDNAGYYWDPVHQWDIEGDSSSGVLSDYYSIITWGLKFGVPTYIIEEMYLSNEEDAAIANDDANLRTIAAAQAQAIVDYFTAHTHEYGQAQIDIPRTCIGAGKRSEHCTLCGHRKNVSAIADSPDQNAHFYRYDHDENGSWTCVYTDSLINQAKLGHEEHAGTGAPTAEVYNEQQNAPLYERDGVPAAAVPDDAPATPEQRYHAAQGMQALSGSPGYAVLVCDDCGDTKRIEFTYGQYDCKKNGHVGFHDEEYKDIAPTCTEEGTAHYFCLACWEEYAETVPALGHTPEVLSETAPTCVTQGEREQKCTVCGMVETVALPATGHAYEERGGRAATCTEDGVRAQVCSVCGDTQKEIVPATGHGFVVTEESKAGLFQSGRTVYTCSLCGFERIDTASARLPLPILLVIVFVILLAAAMLAAVIVIRRRSAAPMLAPMEFDELLLSTDTDAEGDANAQAMPPAESNTDDVAQATIEALRGITIPKKD